MTSRLEARGLVARRGDRTVLDGISFAVRPGEVFGLLGPNGSGKTTLFHLLAGLLAPTAGELLLDGTPLTASASRLRAACGIVFQEPALDPRLTARENLLLAARLYSVPRRAARERAAALLERSGLAERGDEPVSTFSGGMKRRVELARALIHEPTLLILDEPSNGLDEAAFRTLWRDLRARRDERGLTILVTTHRPDEAEQCDTLAILHGGRIVAHDAPASLRDSLAGDLLLLDAIDAADVSRTLADRLGLDSRQIDGRVVLEHERAHELVPRIVEALPDGALRAVEVRRPGLGEVFLACTGHELDVA